VPLVGASFNEADVVASGMDCMLLLWFEVTTGRSRSCRHYRSQSKVWERKHVASFTVAVAGEARTLPGIQDRREGENEVERSR
jgi:hypothetical protein